MLRSVRTGALLLAILGTATAGLNATESVQVAVG